MFQNNQTQLLAQCTIVRHQLERTRASAPLALRCAHARWQPQVARSSVSASTCTSASASTATTRRCRCKWRRCHFTHFTLSMLPTIQRLQCGHNILDFLSNHAHTWR